MKWLRWLPWKFIVSYAARAHGFLDPIALLGRLHHFAQPSEINEPVELLRAGVVLHARGLINSRVIQHNLDWVWPFWVEKQFDPRDDAFIPRAFSLTHINLTHRNWTAIGIPDCEELPIIGPRGLLTPFLDGWSLDCWIVTGDGRTLLPSRSSRRNRRQLLGLDQGVSVTTMIRDRGLALTMRAWVEDEGGRACCRLRVDGRSDTAAWLVIALRPYNPEGVSFIRSIALGQERCRWLIDGHSRVSFNAPVDHHLLSRYRDGDVFLQLTSSPLPRERPAIDCRVGMATAAALFELDPGRRRRLEIRVGLEEKKPAVARPSWSRAMSNRCRLEIPDNRLLFLFDAAQHSLILHSPGDVYPGPYTYKRFWFRDAAFIINALLCSGFPERAERAIDLFPARQKAGYFHSQEGEWDANGEVLWIMHRFCRLTGQPPKEEWLPAILRGARWICDKRLKGGGGELHGGLMPSGFSAEHLGPNDFYFWDDFWSIAGLQAAAGLLEMSGNNGAAARFRREAVEFGAVVDAVLHRVAARVDRAAMPASPYRRLDAGAVGSLAAGYPLQLFRPHDPRLLDTVEFLLENCFLSGGFFQDMIHSGINAYLTLHVAQVLLRAGDPRWWRLVKTVAALAGPTGQWPEAIHPRTLGGCMGDGQHVWAAAEWIMMMRHCFVREEGKGLILAAGIPPAWLRQAMRQNREISFGPAPTGFGRITVCIAPEAGAGKWRVGWQGEWHQEQPPLTIRLGGRDEVVGGDRGSLVVDPEFTKGGRA